MMRNVRQQHGFTLTEMAIVLGVIGTVIGAIWYAASNVHEAQKENNAIVELNTVAQNIVGLMTGQKFQGAYPVNITANMITAQTIPSSYVDSAVPTAADNPWSQGVANPAVFQGLIVWQVAANQFRISFYKVANRQACIALLLGGTNCQSGQSSCPTYVSINAGYAVTAGPAAGSGAGWADSTVMSTSIADAMCSKNDYTGVTNNNGVEFTYTL